MNEKSQSTGALDRQQRMERTRREHGRKRTKESDIVALAGRALMVDGEHHKQFYLRQILNRIEAGLGDEFVAEYGLEPGIAD